MAQRIGTSDTGIVSIPLQARETHVHIFGVSGTGKSKLLEQMIREDIIAGRGFTLLDPNGELYKDIVRWAAASGWGKARQFHLLNPHMQGFGFGFNPLQGHGEASVIVDAAVLAAQQVFGGEDMDAKPRLARVLRTVLGALLANGLTMAEAVDVLEPDRGRGLREMMLQDIDNPIVAAGLRELSFAPPRQFMELTESTMNRLAAFLDARLVRQIVGQSQGVDFREVMDKGEIMLVNLNPGEGLSEGNARLLGTLFINSLFANARTRPEGSRPHYVYIDECYRYLTTDVERILDEGRKYGIHLILSHQRLGQLEHAGRSIKNAVMSNARTKIVFGGLTPEEAQEIEGYLFMGTYDLERVKQSITAPAVVGHQRIILHNASQSQAQSWGESTGISTSTSEGDSEAESTASSAMQGRSHGASRNQGTGWVDNYDLDEQRTALFRVVLPHTGSLSANQGTGVSSSDSQSISDTHGRTRSRSRAQSLATSQSTSQSRAEATSRGHSEALRPIVEERATQTYSLDEQRYEKAALIRNLPKRMALIKLAEGGPATIMRTATVDRPVVAGTAIRAFNARALEASRYTRPVEQIEQELSERRIDIARRMAVEIIEPTHFRQKRPKPRDVVDV